MVILAVNEKGVLRLFDADNLTTQVYELSGSHSIHAGSIRFLTFDADGRRFVTLGTDKCMKILDLRTGTVLLSFPTLPHGLYIASFNNTGDRLATVSDTGRLLIWDTNTGEQLVRWKICEKKATSHGFAYMRIVSLSFGADSQTVVTLGNECDLKVWEAGTGILISHTKPLRDIWGCDVWSNNLSNCIGHDASGDVMYFRPSDSTHPLILRGSRVVIIRFSHDGTRFVTGTLDSIVIVWDYITGLEICRYFGHVDRGKLKDCLFFPDDSRIASLSEDGYLSIWVSSTGEVSQSLLQPYLSLVAPGHQHSCFW